MPLITSPSVSSCTETECQKGNFNRFVTENDAIENKDYVLLAPGGLLVVVVFNHYQGIFIARVFPRVMVCDGKSYLIQ